MRTRLSPLHRLSVGLAILTLIAASCSGPPEPAPRGLSEYTLGVDGVDRDYLLFVPENADLSGDRPLVVNFHGSADNAAGQLEYSAFNATAEEEGIIVVYPNGVDGFWSFDDTGVAFVSAVVDHVAERTPIDHTRVYLIGMSLGGDFASYLTCVDQGRYAAVASIAVLNHHNDPSCAERQPARIMAVAGAADDITTFGTSDITSAADAPGSLADELREWVITNDCAAEPPISQVGNAVVAIYDCTATGAALEVALHAGDHIWPRAAEGFDTNTQIWEFLSRYTTE